VHQMLDDLRPLFWCRFHFPTRKAKQCKEVTNPARPTPIAGVVYMTFARRNISHFEHFVDLGALVNFSPQIAFTNQD